ncbi:FAD-binding oxidoreductase [Pseudomonas asiatica]|uniref:NAD(P)/FAD-dependent oxidoreductase n=1 Tax=Pseudomonas asiatica TaxID=2219225 RepID=UPI001682CFAB|nr:FAD-dependent oxidoreductase [Pseudomonas asiatica]MDH0131673.1 FAD-binding oxidoreductase [Pseudomonas asiatica]QNV67882.1 FAD-dependent oxidoreductase [Pseudomonas sp. CFA]
MHIPKAVPANIKTEWSWWRQDIDRLLPAVEPTFVGGRQYDVAIVGGGFTGLWTALTLKQRNPSLRVSILEAYRAGDGASSRNGGIVHGYWQSLVANIQALGVDTALEIALLGSKAQSAFRYFATAPGRDVDWQEAGNLRVATCPRQEKTLAAFHAACKDLGADQYIQLLPAQKVREIVDNPLFGSGLYFPEAGNVHPGKLVLALRKAVLAAGVAVFENSPVERIDESSSWHGLRVKNGLVLAKDVVLATNVGLAQIANLDRHLSIFSSFASMSNPSEAALKQHHWHLPVGVNDARMFLHYFRKTKDHRVLMGSGSGPVGLTSAPGHPRLRNDSDSHLRARTGMARLLPHMHTAGFARSWGWPIDVSADRLPFFRTLRPGIHCASGFSGHGVQATWIAGQCLASLVLGSKDVWSQSPFCRRRLPLLPFEPLKYLGANSIRWGMLNCEEAEQKMRRGNLAAQGLAALPRLLGLRVGVR